MRCVGTLCTARQMVLQMSMAKRGSPMDWKPMASTSVVIVRE